MYDYRAQTNFDTRPRMEKNTLNFTFWFLNWHKPKIKPKKKFRNWVTNFQGWFLLSSYQLVRVT